MSFSRFITYVRLHRIPILIGMASALLYIVFAYHLERADFIKLLCLYGALFFFCAKLIQFEKWNFKFLLITGIVLRLVFLWAVPNLSQDYFRFIWDGELILEGINPYLQVPNEWISTPGFGVQHAEGLHQGMGSLSAKHYSNYPPLNQWLFAMCAFLGGSTIMGKVMAMRVLIICADVGIFYVGRRLLKKLNRAPHLIFWYFLNPLVIIELTGNLHFEGVMLFFFITALFLLAVDRTLWAGMFYGLSISVKLVPLFFLPLFLRFLGIKKSLLFYMVVAMVNVGLLWPFYFQEFLEHYRATVGLWFSNFEFNAAVYNMVKYWAVAGGAKPWELVVAYGRVTPFINVAVILLLSLLIKKGRWSSLMKALLVSLTVYYLISATVHPWYLIFLVLLAIFTEYRFPLLWSAMVILSYFAYSQPEFKESPWLLLIEYLVVIGFMGYEFFKIENLKSLIQKKTGFK